MAPFEWAKNFNYEKYEKNIINEDIIPDDLFTKIQQIISSYCGINYTTVKSSYYSGHSRDCNDTGGTSNCSCDISGTYCYPANCSTDRIDPNCTSDENNAIDSCYNNYSNGICNCNACYSSFDSGGCPKDKKENQQD